MAKKRKKNPAAQPSPKPVEESRAPKFEIGVKGDEFDLKFSRAASEKTGGADALLRSLSKETRNAGYDLLCLAVPALVLILMAVSFFALSRSGNPPKLSLSALADGSYTDSLAKYYSDTLPFKYYLQSAAHALGFGDAPEKIIGEPDEPDIPDKPDEPIDTEPTEPSEPATRPTTEPSVTSLPDSETPTTASTEDTEPIEPPETFTMYARSTLNIRLTPDSNSMIMGYFEKNDKVKVIEIMDDGWASIWYNDIVAYVSSDLLSEKKIKSTTATETDPPETEPAEETTLPSEETSVPESSEAASEPEETTPEPSTMSPEESAYLEWSYQQQAMEEWYSTSVPETTAEPPTEPPVPAEPPEASETEPSASDEL